jgi:hypothetical protein
MHISTSSSSSFTRFHCVLFFRGAGARRTIFHHRFTFCHSVPWIETDVLRSSSHRVHHSAAAIRKADTKVSMAPAPSSTQQKGLVAEFIGVTAADKTTAGKVLKQHNWNLSAAINA